MHMQNLSVLALLAGLGAASVAKTTPSLSIVTLTTIPSSSRTTPCPSAGTMVCEDFVKSCGSPTPTALLTYGGCHDACVHPTFSTPSCPTPTTSRSSTRISCTLTYTVCEDHLKSCGYPTPTAVLTYGGCHGACEHPTYSPPPCPTPKPTA
ncbi:hypothetical protein F5Y17DRAFT_417136 [Xylariaceae sp. FL0594]|nr:hypothetical protein F5Y17DRAFT_417136 [Xylariaceae sp. FL0594]